MEVKDAVRNAIAFAREVLRSDRTAGIRLEEIESSTVDERPVWLITLSNALIPSGEGREIARAMMAIGADLEREYKVLTVAKDAGEVLSMRIRLLATPGQ